MYKHLTIVPATVNDALQIAPYLRSADKAELEAVTGQGEVLPSLLHGIGCGKAWVIKEDKPIVLFGVAPLSITTGIPWMVATDDLIKNKRFVLRHSKHYVQKMLKLYPDGLLNYIDARNTVHIAYIKRLGFVIDGLTDSYGASKLPFYRFSLNLKKEGVSSAPQQ